MEKKINRNAFGHACPEYDSAVEAYKPMKQQWGLELDKETGSTIPTVVDEINLDELIQSFKDQCGMEAAQKMIAQSGDLNMFADDGQHSGDSTLPDNVNDAYRLSMATAQAAAQDGYGTGMSEAQVTDLIKKILSEAQAQTQAVETKKEGE